MIGKRDKGAQYEQWAHAWLQKKGLKPLHQNYHCRYGEIDLIMLHHEVLCFIEVKYRKNRAFGGSAYSIPLSKQQKVTRSALNYLTQNPKYRQYALRFDALLIEADNQVEWIQNAFCAEV